MSEWIKCNERLPSMTVDVLVYSKWGISKAHLLSKEYWVDDNINEIEEVTHWMSLPDSPKE